MLLIDGPNIFRGAGNDYNIRTMECKRSNVDPIVIRIARVIYEETGVKVFENIKYRGREYVQARYIFMVILAESTTYTQLLISSMVGKDHATLHFAKKYCDNMYQTEKSFRELFDKIEKRVKLLK